MEEKEFDSVALRATRTPISASGDVLGALAEIYERTYPGQCFITIFFKFMWDDENTSGDFQISELEDIVKADKWALDMPFTDEYRSAAIDIGLLMTACAFCVQSMKSRDNLNLAWCYALEANYWLGIIQGKINGRSDLSALTKFAKSGSDARHTENRSMKSDVFKWLDTHMTNFTSMDSAAEAITKQQPIAFRTARDWTSQWKKQRPTGTP